MTEREKIYRTFFKKEGVTLKGFKEEKIPNSTISVFRLSGGLTYFCRWFKNRNVASVGKVEENIQEDMIQNPNIPIVVEKISQMYKSEMKKKSSLQKLVSMILEDMCLC